MAALNLLDASYYAVTFIMWALLAAIAVGAVWFVAACATARRDEQRLERTFAHPSNVTVTPRGSFYDWELDA